MANWGLKENTKHPSEGHLEDAVTKTWRNGGSTGLTLVCGTVPWQGQDEAGPMSPNKCYINQCLKALGGKGLQGRVDPDVSQRWT